MYFYISTSRRMCAVPDMAVLCSSLISSCPLMLFRDYLSGFEMVPTAPIVTGITFALTRHMRCISIVRSLYIIIIIIIL